MSERRAQEELRRHRAATAVHRRQPSEPAEDFHIHIPGPVYCGTAQDAGMSSAAAVDDYATSSFFEGLPDHGPSSLPAFDFPGDDDSDDVGEEEEEEPFQPSTPERLQSYREQIDRLTADSVDWLPYGRSGVTDVPRTFYYGTIRHRDILEPYMPDRVTRQLGYVQTIPRYPIVQPEQAIRSAISLQYMVQYAYGSNQMSWPAFPLSYARVELGDTELDDGPGRCTPDYMAWFRRHSHPHVLPPTERGEPSRPVAGHRRRLSEAVTRVHRVSARLVPYRAQDAVLQEVTTELEGLCQDFDSLLWELGD